MHSFSAFVGFKVQNYKLFRCIQKVKYLFLLLNYFGILCASIKCMDGKQHKKTDRGAGMNIVEKYGTFEIWTDGIKFFGIDAENPNAKPRPYRTIELARKMAISANKYYDVERKDRA